MRASGSLMHPLQTACFCLNLRRRPDRRALIFTNCTFRRCIGTPGRHGIDPASMPPGAELFAHLSNKLVAAGRLGNLARGVHPELTLAALPGDYWLLCSPRLT